jgi:TonB family protein
MFVEESPYPQDVYDDSFSESTAPPAIVTWVISNRRLALGLAAAVLLFLTVGGAWYFRQNRPGTATAASTPAPLSNPSSSVFSDAANNLARVPIHASSAKLNIPVSGNSSPVQSAKTPAVQNFPLAAPVVNRTGRSQQSGADLPAFEANAPSSGADLFAAAVRPREPAMPLPIGGDVKSARLIKSVPPVYPHLAKTQRISGSVQIDALVDTSGSVATTKVLSGPLILQQAALDAVKQWKYSPALVDGQPTSVHVDVTVRFDAFENSGLARPPASRDADSHANSHSASPEPSAAGGSIGRSNASPPLPVGGDLKPAQLLKSVPPVYPQLARQQRVSGSVQIDTLIDSSGNVSAAKVLAGPALLQAAAVDAVKQWKYSPALLDGQPTSMHVTVVVQFRPK